MKVNIKSFLINVIYISICLMIVFMMLSKQMDDKIFVFLFYGMQLITLISCITYFITIRKIRITKFHLIIVMLITLEIIISIINESLHFPDSYFDMLNWPLTLLVFWNYFSENDITKFIKKSIFIMYLIFILLSIPLIQIHLISYGNHGGIIFPIYFCITMLPCLLYFEKNNKIKILSIVLAFAIIISSTKRAGGLALILGIICYYIAQAYISKNGKEKIKKYLKYILLFLIVFVSINIYIKNNDLVFFERLLTLGEDEGSGRGDIWRLIIQEYNNSDLLRQIFGHGFQSVYFKLEPLGASRFAHNSYMEFLYDGGILGLSLLLSIFYKLIKITVKSGYQRNELFPSLIFALVISTFFSCFSYFFESSVIIMPLTILWGYALGSDYRKTYKQHDLK